MSHHRFTKFFVVNLLALSLVLNACIAPVAPQAAGAVADPNAPLPVVATYSILGDLVANVGGDHVEVVTLVGPDGDAHTFEPTPADGVALTEAALIFVNGVEFESWLPDLHSAAGATAQQVVVSEGLDLLAMGEHGDEHAAEDTHAAVAPRRLFVADGKEGVVRLLNLDDGETLTEYALSGPARLYTGPGETLAFAVQRDQNLVNVLDSGVRFVVHEDHYDLDLSDPALLDFTLELAEPTHFVAHGEQIIFFNDGDGTATLLTEATIRGGDAPLTFESGRAHHGVAVTLGDAMLLSLPNPNDEKAILPVGVTVHRMDGVEVARFADCPGLHGEASIGAEMVAFGCSDGVLLVQQDSGSFSAQKIANPTDNPNEARVGTLHYSPEAGMLVGNFSREGITLFDLAALTMTPMRTPSPMWTFALADHDPHTIVVLTLDGNLHTIDGESGAITGSVAVIPAFEPPQQGAEGVVLPALHVAGEMAYVSDPNAGTVNEVHLVEMAVERTFSLPGMPYALAAFGALPDAHTAGHSDAHQAHQDEPGHAHGEFDPHLWHDPHQVVAMVETIRAALAVADPANAEAYAANAAAYTAQLQELDGWIEEQVGQLPAERRKLVTTHDTFGYFAARYGFEVVGTAIASFSTEASDPSPTQLAALVEEIQRTGVPAIFAENISNTRLMEQVAREAGVVVAPPLYTDALGEPGSAGETYLAMMRANVTIIVDALRE
jgi:ABC-type Zn uptake system ZnuABC Zn-binding protein ZnuA